MVKCIVKIDKIDTIKQFVYLSNKQESDIILSRGKFVVDAKSLLGVISLDTSEDCELVYDEEKVSADFMTFVNTLCTYKYYV